MVCVLAGSSSVSVAAAAASVLDEARSGTGSTTIHQYYL